MMIASIATGTSHTPAMLPPQPIVVASKAVTQAEATATETLVTEPATGQQPANNAVEPAVTITLSPGADNVEHGDRSENSVDIAITTANSSAEFSVSREQVADSLQAKLLKNTLSSIGGPSVPGPLVIAGLTQGADTGNAAAELRETSASLLNTKLSYNTAQRALNSYSNNSPSSSVGLFPAPASGSGNSSGGSDLVSLSNQATNYYIKSTLFFSAVDSAQQRVDERA